jgi:hypothetical protein
LEQQFKIIKQEIPAPAPVVNQAQTDTAKP